MTTWTKSLPDEDLQSLDTAAYSDSVHTDNGAVEPGALDNLQLQLQSAEASQKAKVKTSVGVVLLLLLASGLLAGKAIFCPLPGKYVLGENEPPLHPSVESREACQALNAVGAREEEQRKPSDRAREEAAAKDALAPEKALMQLKLEKIQELFAYAESFVYVIGTEEAEKLADNVEQQLGKAQSLSKEPGKLEAIEECLQDAVKNLRNLDRLAGKHCEFLISVEGKSGEFPSLWDTEPAADFASFEDGGLDPVDTVHRMVIMFNSMQQAFQKVGESFEKVSRVLLAKKHFNTEEDTQLVEDKLDDLHFLNSSIKSKNGFHELARKLKADIHEGIRAKELRSLEEEMLLLLRDFTPIQLSAKLARKANEMKVKASLVEAFELSFVEEKAKEVNGLLATLHQQVTQVETTSGENMFYAVNKAQETAQEARELLHALREQAKTLLPVLPSSLFSLRKLMFVEETERIHDLCILEGKVILSILEDARFRAQKWLDPEDYSPGHFHQLGSEIFEGLLSNIRQLKGEVGTRVSRSRMAFIESQEAENPDAALTAMKSQARYLVQLVKVKEEARLVLLDIKSLELLRKDIDLLQAAGLIARLCKVSNTFAAMKLLSSVAKDYSKAHKSVMDAKTLVEVSDNMVRLRSAVTAMYSAVAAHKTGEDFEEAPSPL
ncbi:hypothetical protein, conserved [Eimeria tenella]|uniref:Transmembrane protein n=1 Tax=Eimeria tenella TaxID=5802 RepID=U6KUD4_EIMTE|nr:hypothetical protein, conserved [Eimeria tenella]CDJ41767.1 hypothetical protein, conserved [Eimeria tenella]|eukprot:XP_013232517.1 hypothetical protein, conserved [Eimeria tenella]